MKVAIIGGGFTGLSCAIELLDKGYEIVLYEENDKVGGLANSFNPGDWEWNLEKYYHHIFSNDKSIIEMAEKVGCPAFFTMPKTNSLINGKIKQLDSPMSVLRFDELSVRSRLRMGAGLAALRVIKNGKGLEKYLVAEVLPKLIGEEAYHKIWGRLLKAKFGNFLPEVNLAWFWARVVKRTQSLGYFEGGFGQLASDMAKYITNHQGRIVLGKKIAKIKRVKRAKYQIGDEIFDKVIMTVPAPIANKIIGEGVAAQPEINYLWGQTLVLELDRSLMDGYWLNILEDNWPFLVAVEHTNFIDRKHYGDKIIVYLGNYLEDGDKRLKMDENELSDLYLPYLIKINKNFSKEWLLRKWKFQSPYSQPVFPVDYSRLLPEIKTKLPNLYLANMSMVYPWDRGTNYAVELGQRVANLNYHK